MAVAIVGNWLLLGAAQPLESLPAFFRTNLLFFVLHGLEVPTKGRFDNR